MSAFWSGHVCAAAGCGCGVLLEGALLEGCAVRACALLSRQLVTAAGVSL